MGTSFFNPASQRNPSYIDQDLSPYSRFGYDVMHRVNELHDHDVGIEPPPN